MEGFPPGFRFYPTEEELVSFYLYNKLESKREDLNLIMNRIIPVLNIYEFKPEDLPQFSGDFCQEDPEQWFFFIPRQENEARGGRPNRLTASGYWKATGSPGLVYSSSSRIIGLKRTMVFYKGRAPNGRKTDWKMNEYKAIEGEASPSTGVNPTLRQEFSLCRIYKKSKCLHAFDRRPVGMQEIGDLRAQQAPSGAGNDQPIIATAFQNPSMVMSHSPQGSSSGEHGLILQAAESSNNTAMAMDDILSDWNQWNWFYDGEDMQLNTI